MLDEFDIIGRYFAPLSGEEGLLLQDDAAHYQPKANCTQILTKDMLVENIHFLPDTDPADLAWKILAVNISDLISKGATPKGYLLGIGYHKAPNHDWLYAFTKGLAEAQKHFGLTLWGGDTVKSPGGLFFSVTAIGETPTNAPNRSKAKDGQSIYVSGHLGGASYGLDDITKGLDQTDLAKCYKRPKPPLDLKDLVLSYAAASADISDGLLADAGHIMQASSMGAEIQQDKIPLHPKIQDPDIERCITWGDDYEIIFTVPLGREEDMLRYHAVNCTTPISKIGVVRKQDKVKLLDKQGQEIIIERKGFTHFKEG